MLVVASNTPTLLAPPPKPLAYDGSTYQFAVVVVWFGGLLLVRVSRPAAAAATGRCVCFAPGPLSLAGPAATARAAP